ncbi:MAG: hypothetical protein J3K34DRAFT_395113 [Monoraphidium minutum]|nr:MAG: hypothetical protein J3K34DRAFT_395113 [Monoraphidium minutum]
MDMEFSGPGVRASIAGRRSADAPPPAAAAAAAADSGGDGYSSQGDDADLGSLQLGSSSWRAAGAAGAGAGGRAPRSGGASEASFGGAAGSGAGTEEFTDYEGFEDYEESLLGMDSSIAPSPEPPAAPPAASAAPAPAPPQQQAQPRASAGGGGRGRRQWADAAAAEGSSDGGFGGGAPLDEPPPALLPAAGSPAPRPATAAAAASPDPGRVRRSHASLSREASGGGAGRGGDAGRALRASTGSTAPRGAAAGAAEGGLPSAAAPPAAAAPAPNEGSLPEKPRPPRRRRDAAAGPSQPQYIGDLSEWGRAEVDGFYDAEGSGDDQSTVAGTLSSGLSPRGDGGPAARPFELGAARQALAHGAAQFGRAMALRRDGTAPAARGVSDDLPTRLAYQQLSVLAGMAGKVQDAILHNKRIFEQRMAQEERSLARRAFQGWLAKTRASAAKRRRGGRAAARIARGALARCFFSWREELHLVDQTLAMTRKARANHQSPTENRKPSGRSMQQVRVVVARGMLRRVLAAWRRLVEERWWKTQLALREREGATLEAKIRGYEKRSVTVIQKRRLRLLLREWRTRAAGKRAARARAARADALNARQQQRRAWRAWVNAAEAGARRRVLLQKAQRRCDALAARRAWQAWRGGVDMKKAQAESQRKAAAHAARGAQSKALAVWRGWAAARRRRAALEARWRAPLMARALGAWRAAAARRKGDALALKRAAARREQRFAGAAFAAWAGAARDRRADERLREGADLEARARDLAAENERLRRDNERFVRLIDSGEWGRGRVAELVGAGEVLKGERDALLKLIQSLRREYEALQAAKGAQEDELRGVKDRMTLGGPARNRMLVKGGSSFNALVRAMKQDLLESGAAQRSPALLYEIDKLSMDRVQVYPDGELAVTAVTSPGGVASPGQSPTRGRAASGGGGGGSPLRASSSAAGYAAAFGAPLPGGGRPASAGGGGGAAARPRPPAGGHSTLTLSAGREGAPDAGGGAGGGAAAARLLAAVQGLSASEVAALEGAPPAGGGGARRPGGGGSALERARAQMERRRWSGAERDGARGQGQARITYRTKQSQYTNRIRAYTDAWDLTIQPPQLEAAFWAQRRGAVARADRVLLALNAGSMALMACASPGDAPLLAAAAAGLVLCAAQLLLMRAAPGLYWRRRAWAAAAVRLARTACDGRYLLARQAPARWPPGSGPWPGWLLRRLLLGGGVAQQFVLALGAPLPLPLLAALQALAAAGAVAAAAVAAARGLADAGLAPVVGSLLAAVRTSTLADPLVWMLHAASARRGGDGGTAGGAAGGAAGGGVFGGDPAEGRDTLAFVVAVQVFLVWAVPLWAAATLQAAHKWAWLRAAAPRAPPPPPGSRAARRAAAAAAARGRRGAELVAALAAHGVLEDEEVFALLKELQEAGPPLEEAAPPGAPPVDPPAAAAAAPGGAPAAPPRCGAAPPAGALAAALVGGPGGGGALQAATLHLLLLWLAAALSLEAADALIDFGVVSLSIALHVPRFSGVVSICSPVHCGGVARVWGVLAVRAPSPAPPRTTKGHEKRAAPVQSVRNNISIILAPAPVPPPAPQPAAGAAADEYLVGANAYWMPAAASWGDTKSVDTVLDSLQRLGVRLVRTWAFNENMPSAPGVYSEAELGGLDYFVSAAAARGMRVMLTLGNFWNAYKGPEAWLAWAAAEGGTDGWTGDVLDFYRQGGDGTARRLYEEHLTFMLSRTNTLTGRRYASDPAVYAYSVLNEPRCPGCGAAEIVAHRSWLSHMGRHVRSLASESILVLASTEGFFEGALPVARSWGFFGLFGGGGAADAAGDARDRQAALAKHNPGAGAGCEGEDVLQARGGGITKLGPFDAMTAHLYWRRPQTAAATAATGAATAAGLTMHQFDEEQRKVVFATVLRALAASKRAGGAFKAALFWNAAHPGINSNNTDVWSGQDTAYEILITPPTGATAGLDGSDPRPRPPAAAAAPAAPRRRPRPAAPPPRAARRPSRRSSGGEARRVRAAAARLPGGAKGGAGRRALLMPRRMWGRPL